MQGETTMNAPLLGENPVGHQTTVGSATLKKGKLGDNNNYIAEGCSKHKSTHRNHSGRPHNVVKSSAGGGSSSNQASANHSWQTASTSRKAKNNKVICALESGHGNNLLHQN
mmetsp:Transcript_13601/g.17219  ORF Transcript_13601/g.17219 Transcript_13601/m.17219 type:complete len:112 (-) Transcript_13601:3800-4135(-)